MTRQCCKGGGIRRAAASLLPGVALVLLPKCPLCLAAWLAVAAGVTVSATTAGFVRWGIVVVWVIELVIFAARRKPFGSSSV
jgi:predicted transporter